MKFLKIALILVLTFLTMHLTGVFDKYISSQNITSFYCFKILIFLITCILSLSWLIDIRKSNQKNTIKNSWLSFTMIAILLLSIEFTFTFIPISNQNMIPLSSLTWEAFYHRKTNDVGFRDEDVSKKVVADKQKLFFIGDSYTFGFGIKNKKHRYTDILAEKINSEYVAYNFGRSGISTKEEFEILKQVSDTIKPDAIIWQYFFNDVNDICFEHLNYYPNLDVYNDIHSIPRWVVKRSYFVNYLFHKFYPNKGYKEFMDFFTACANDKQVQSAYLNQLREIQQYCDERNIELFFLIIPNPMHPSLTKKQDDAIEHYLTSLDVKYLNITDQLLEIPINDRIISSQDMHLSKKSHRIVAKKLHQFYTENKLFNN